MHGNIFIINVEELTCLILCKGILFYSTIKKLQEEEKIGYSFNCTFLMIKQNYGVIFQHGRYNILQMYNNNIGKKSFIA